MKTPAQGKTTLEQALDALIKRYTDAVVRRYRNCPALRLSRGFDSALVELWRILTDPAGVKPERLDRLEKRVDRLWVELNHMRRLRRLAKRRG